MKILSTELRRLRHSPGNVLTIILYFTVVASSYVHYMLSKEALKSLPQLLASMYNGPAFCLLALIIGLHVCSYMHQKGDAMIVSSLKDKASLVFNRFKAIALRLFTIQLITTLIGIGVIFLGFQVECDEPFYAILVFLETYLTYLFVASFSCLVSVLITNELVCDLLCLLLSVLPLGANALLLYTHIDVTGVLVTSTYYELMKDVTIYQGLLSSLLALLYTIAFQLLAAIIVRAREIS